MLRKIRHKFSAKPVKTRDGTYQSTAEYDFKLRLDTQKQSGEVLFYLEQSPIRLPGKTRYIVDFIVFYANGEVRFIDVKGRETPQFIQKKRQVEELYPIEIVKIRKKYCRGGYEWEEYK